MGGSLEGKGGVPHFGGGESLAGGVIRVLPEIAWQLLPASLEAFRLFLNKMDQGVVAGIHWGLTDIVRLFVFVTDVFVSQG